MVLYNSHHNGNNIKCFENSTIYIEDTTIHANQGGCVESQGGTVYVTNGNFNQTGEATSANAMCGSASYGGSLTVYSGTYTSENYGLYAFRSGGTITVYDGTFTAAKAVLKADSYTTEPAGVFFIHGGSFDGSIEISEGSSLTITGGTFKNTSLSLEQFKTYVADGYTVTEANGVYTVR